MSRCATAVLLASLLPGACAPFAQTSDDRSDKVVLGGDPRRGAAILRTGAHGCAGCHEVPGIRFPRGVAGPSLGGLVNRAFIAGQLPNTPDVLVAFLQDPPSLVAQTGMPDVRLSLEDARHVAAYLYAVERRHDP